MLSVTFHVPLSIERCWTFVAEDYFENHPRWDPGLTRLDRLDDGPLRPGTRGREVRSFAGEQIGEFEVVGLDRPRRLVLRDVPGLWSLERSYTFRPDGDGTAVTFGFDMRPERWWFRLLFPVVSRLVIYRQVRANMERLRTLLTEQRAAVD
jgi:hypothetical protein